MITVNQHAMLTRIARSLYTTVNGGEPKTLEDVGTIWLDDVCEDNSDKGTLTSLQNAGLILMYSDKRKRSHLEPSDSTVELTQAGFDAYKAGQPKEQ